MTSLPKYDKTSACKRCGAAPSSHLCESCKRSYGVDFVVTTFVAKGERIQVNGGNYFDLENDAMLRTCSTCSFQWLEKPKK